MRPTDFIHRVNGVGPGRRAVVILPVPSPLSQSHETRSTCPFQAWLRTPGVSCQVLAKYWRWRASDQQIVNPDEFITFLSAISLVNDRFAFYWYPPLFGTSGFAAMFANHVTDMIERRNGGRS